MGNAVNGRAVHEKSFQKSCDSKFAYFDVNVKIIALAVCVKVSCKQSMSKVFSSDIGFDVALEALRDDALVGVPTETVYGLAADATNEQAVAKIYKSKGRPSFNPLIAHVSGVEMAQRYGAFPELALKLADAFWPGPLTIVVPLNESCGIAHAVTAGLGTIALRHPLGVMAKLAEALDAPIAAPSANTSGKISPTTAQHVLDDLGDKVAVVLDGGACAVGLESTVVKVDGEKIILLREGGLSAEMIEAQMGKIERGTRAPKVEAPGMLLKHYAPRLPLRINANSVRADEALIAFGTPLDGAMATRNLSKHENLEEAANRLFAIMKELEDSGAHGIAVQPIPNHGLGAAINDRLKRAAEGSGD
jgi:L-threonylcarbamoyladenylate synthase